MPSFCLSLPFLLNKKSKMAAWAVCSHQCVGTWDGEPSLPEGLSASAPSHAVCSATLLPFPCCGATFVRVSLLYLPFTLTLCGRKEEFPGAQSLQFFLLVLSLSSETFAFPVDELLVCVWI